ncbi:efflux RND transporter periplasmic adaptor subunit [Alloacidobacterium dinghuense]|uniref:efflux RND transporter periplasmic adaptor subunit n=1 Tax=Alloacidobacterium dinghuense TaxID=2763107 RepID=UPI002036D31F|nr:efflux RND transporter periplasmic adaptor subunit [Alloacidobacterium dinghuense]
MAFAVVLFVILRRHDDPAKTAAAPGGGRRGFGGPVTLTVATAQKGDIGVYRDAIGTVTPVYTASIYNQVTGVITQVHYREGQTVQKGDPLVDIDPRQYEAQVESAQGALERDTNLLAQAKMDLNRYQQAWDRKAIAKQQLDDQEKIVAQNEGLVRADQGTLDFDKVQLSYCHITAPFTGRVGLRLIDPGNLVQSSGSTVLAVLTQVQPITVVFTLAQDYLPDVFAQKGRGVGLSVDAYDREQTKKLASGKLLALDNQIDTTTGTVKLRATFDNRDGALFPNQFVNTRLLVTTEHGMTLIPSSAIQHNGQVSFVYVIADGTAHLKNVKAGVSDHGITAVEGINPGDQLATSSFEKLQSGSKVTISKQPLSQSNSETEAP